MEFYPYEPLDRNNAHNKLWDWIKEAFKDEQGVAFYRYPVFKKSGNLMREPDVVLLHRTYGLWVFECKGCTIGNVAAIQGHSWQMRNWHSEEETPLLQAEDQMYAIQNKLNSQRELRGKINYFFRAALPEVKSKEWQDKGFLQHTEKAVWMYEDLTHAALKKNVATVGKERPQALDDETWALAIKIIGGTLPRTEPRLIPTSTPPISPLRVIHEIESNLKVLDEIQQKIAFEVPDGPQRLRGLAGTGKTVLFAKRVAKLHIKYPDWNIGFVFFSRSLYDQILELITLYCQELGECDPNWHKIKVMHCWGGSRQNGFYYDLAKRAGIKPLIVNDVKNSIGQVSPNESFEYICLSLARHQLINGGYSSQQVSQITTIENLEPSQILAASEEIQAAYIEAEAEKLLFPQLYDALIVDEGQDLPPICYKLFLSSLREPKRLYWAYDEAQGIGSLTIPSSAAMFGRDAEGKPRVDVTGIYIGGIQKSHRMHRCYRTPQLLLMTAHALNMGLLRQGGALQGVTTKEDWEALGYTITAGDFSAASVSQGRTVTLTREQKASPHPIDQASKLYSKGFIG